MSDDIDKKTEVVIEDVEPEKIPWKARFKGHSTEDEEITRAAIAMFPDGVPPDEEKRLVRILDLFIIPILAVCYIFYYIDKTTLSYAAIFGIIEDLPLVGDQYSWLSSIFYFGWLAFAFPTNLLIQRLPVAKYLGLSIFLWGVFLIAQAGAKDFGALAALRFVSGMGEATADPAFMIITSMWYTRSEQPLRIALWYSANGLGIAFGGLMGYAIGHIKGALPSWKYEFIVIGAICSLWAIVMGILLPDSPTRCRFFNRRRKMISIARKVHDQTGIENKHFKWEQAKEFFTDYKSYIYFLFGFSANIPNGGISNFGTLIIQGFNYDTLGTSLLQIPYGAFISVMILCAAFINGKLPKDSRIWVMCLFILPNIAGTLGLLLCPEERHIPRLICYYLTGSYNATFVLGLSLITSNVSGHTKKMLTTAANFLGVAVGNIAGPFFYKTSQAPVYRLGIGSMLVANVIEVACMIALRFAYAHANSTKDKLEKQMEERGEALPDEAETAFSDLTDKQNIRFRYIL